jgi:hypothetical protein
MPNSKYASKVRGSAIPQHHRRPEWRRKRVCSQCGRDLAGKKGHGFPSASGRGVYCGGCRFPR